jgi:hypothetical protein
MHLPCLNTHVMQADERASDRPANSLQASYKHAFDDGICTIVLELTSWQCQLDGGASWQHTAAMYGR